MADNRYAYIQRENPDHETFHLHLRPVWRSYWKGFSLSLLLLGVMNIWGETIMGILLSFSILVSILFRRYRRLFIVTSKRVMARIGLISIHLNEVEIRHSREFRIRQGIMGRLMRYGIFEISTAAGTGPEVIFTNVGYPNDLKEAVRNVRNGL